MSARQIPKGPENRGGQAVQRLFTGLLCFAVLYGLCGCAAFKDSSSNSWQESPPQQSETKSPGLIPETAQVCLLDPAACVPQTTSPVAAPEKAAPVVQVPETSFDFGKMNEDKVFVHKFQIKNAGTSDLIIKKILPG
jgi:hypothetical protein